jgi:hypothetical protein
MQPVERVQDAIKSTLHATASSLFSHKSTHSIVAAAHLITSRQGATDPIDPVLAGVEPW